MSHQGKLVSEISWDHKGQPRSVQFDDKYFCQENGLLESQYVFCGGNRLEERFKALPAESFFIGETGFGSGLNFLCAWALWERCAPPGARLHYVSIDKYPMSRDDLSRALKLWPELSGYAEALLERYTPVSQTILFHDRLRLTLYIDDVVNALACMSTRHSVDAWFLDGFAPSKNPDMWSPDVFARMARVSHDGTTVSTFTVAGNVRRGLAQTGFMVKKVKGFGSKREMLTGYFGKAKAVSHV